MRGKENKGGAEGKGIRVTHPRNHLTCLLNVPARLGTGLMWKAMILLILSTDGLGPVLRHDGFQIKPPRGFRMARMDLFHGTQAGTLSLRPGTQRYLSAALVDTDSEDAASMLISVIEAPMALRPSSRDELSTAVVRHFREDLDQPFQLERAEVTNGRVEVLGSIRQGSQLRRILVAAWPGEHRHIVILCSAPSGRWETLAASVSESLDSLKVESAVLSQPDQRFLWAFTALLGAMLLISVGLWRRRHASSNRDDINSR